MAANSNSHSDQSTPSAPECWILLECPQGKILRESLEAVTVGLMFQNQFNIPATVLWTGLPPEDNQLEYIGNLGINKILYLAGDLQRSSCEADLLMGLKSLYLEKKPQHLLFGQSPSSLRLAPQLAALLNVGYIGNTTYLRKIGSALNLTRPILQGKLSEILSFTDPSQGMISLHPRSFGLPAPRDDITKPVTLETRDIPLLPEKREDWTVVETGQEPSHNLDVEDAEIIVAGGKGIGSKKGFELLQELAEALGGTVAASRIAVDLGWASKDRLVGQTGKRVQPELYIACGISGAHQHRAGMKDSRYILAINTDPVAPIFQFATWGIQGDACQVVKAMIALVNPSAPLAEQ